MAGKSSSIAGRAHGAVTKPAGAQMAQYRPQLAGLPGVHPEVSRAIQTAFDDLYRLRNENQKLQGQIETMGKTHAAAMKGMNDQLTAQKINNQATGILGLNINSATDPKSLQNGWTLRYSTESGMFEFGV